MIELFNIAVDDNQPFEVRYDAVRMMAQQKSKGLPKWKVRVLKHAVKNKA